MPSPKHIMTSNTVTRAENGYILEVYNPAADETIKVLARSPTELREAWNNWSQERISTIIAAFVSRETSL